jgi:hypothetical protein
MLGVNSDSAMKFCPKADMCTSGKTRFGAWLGCIQQALFFLQEPHKV